MIKDMDSQFDYIVLVGKANYATNYSNVDKSLISLHNLDELHRGGKTLMGQDYGDAFLIGVHFGPGCSSSTHPLSGFHMGSIGSHTAKLNT
jgi:hypothetical protein